MNVVAIRGTLARPAEARDLPSGARLASYQVTVSREGEAAETVPVVWFDPPSGVTALDAGCEVVVTGRVRRRFFKTAGGTASRTEVVADALVPVRQGKRVTAALERARRSLDGLGEPPDGRAAQRPSYTSMKRR